MATHPCTYDWGPPLTLAFLYLSFTSIYKNYGWYAAASPVSYCQLSASCGAGLIVDTLQLSQCHILGYLQVVAQDRRWLEQDMLIVETPLLPPCRILGYLQVVGWRGEVMMGQVRAVSSYNHHHLVTSNTSSRHGIRHLSLGTDTGRL